MKKLFGLELHMMFHRIKKKFIIMMVKIGPLSNRPEAWTPQFTTIKQALTLELNPL
jgi:hypothetical protein